MERTELERAVLEPAPAGSEAFYRLWADMFDIAWRMALREGTREDIEAVGRMIAEENRSRDEALERMLSTRDPHEPTRAVARAIDSLGRPFCLTGGPTDFLLHVRPEESRAVAEEVTAALRDRGFAHLQRADRRRIEDKLVLHYYWPIRDQGVSVRMDVILAEGEYDARVLERRVRAKVDSMETWVASCEDLILLKLLAQRPIDVADAKALWKANEKGLDRAYLDSWAQRLGVAAVWEETLRGEP